MNTFSSLPLVQQFDPTHIIVAESEGTARHELISFMSHRGISATAVANSTELTRALATQDVDAVILDQYLGQQDCLGLLRDIRVRSQVPVIVIGGERSSEIDRVVGLEFGADDYLSKPYGVQELLARIRAVRRRYMVISGMGQKQYKCYRFNGWHFDQRQRRLRRPDGAESKLTKSEFAMLSAFVIAPRRLLSREHLLGATRRHEDIYDRSIDVQVLRLRRKLQDDPRTSALIRTERGMGYVFEADVQVVPTSWSLEPIAA